MSDLLNSLLPLHRIASSQGGGLLKELLDPLEKNMCRGQNVEIPEVKVQSIGSRHQDFADDDIANSNCVKLHASAIINR